MLAAQDPKPSYNNDTLYTTCGYKIYKGQTLQFEKGTGKKGQFRFINITNGIAAVSLKNNSITENVDDFTIIVRVYLKFANSRNKIYGLIFCNIE